MQHESRHTKELAFCTPSGSLPFTTSRHRKLFSQKPDNMFRLVTAKPKRNNCHNRELVRLRSTTTNLFFFAPAIMRSISVSVRCIAYVSSLQKWPTHCHELGRTHTAVGRSCAVPHGPSTSKSTPILTAGTRGR